MNLTSSQAFLERTRAAICALTNTVDRGVSTPVHFHRLAHFLRFHIGNTALQASLEKLEFLGEIYRLQHGYWYPSATRRIAIGDFHLIASALPIHELNRHLGSGIVFAGSMRMSVGAIPALQQQSFESWSHAPESTRQWTERKIAIARRSLMSTSIDSNVVRLHACRKTHANRFELGTWCRMSEIGSLARPTLYLCREPTIGNHSRYFLAEISGSSILREAPINPNEQRRIRFGIDVIEQRHLTVRVYTVPEGYSFSLRRAIPNEEARVLEAISTVVPIEPFGVSYTFASKYLATITKLLNPLGIRLELRQ